MYVFLIIMLSAFVMFIQLADIHGFDFFRSELGRSFESWPVTDFFLDYGSQLSGGERLAYDAMDRAWKDFGDPVEIDFGCTDHGDLGMAAWQHYAVGRAYRALDLDRPDLFWIGGLSIEPLQGGCRVVVTPVPDDTHSMYGLVLDSLRLELFGRAFAGILRFFPSRADKVAIIRKWIISNNCYDWEAAGGVPWSRRLDLSPWVAPSAFDPDEDIVCSGYARAFKYLCDASGVPCAVVPGYFDGGAHEWNVVRLDDGMWYGEDVTLGGSSFFAGKRYHLLGSGSATAGDAFSESHVPDFGMYGAFAVPRLSVLSAE